MCNLECKIAIVNRGDTVNSRIPNGIDICFVSYIILCEEHLSAGNFRKDETVYDVTHAR